MRQKAQPMIDAHRPILFGPHSVLYAPPTRHLIDSSKLLAVPVTSMIAGESASPE